MEKGRAHSQPTPHPNRTQRSATAPTVKQQRQAVTIAYLMKLLEARPWAFWGGMWASLFLVMMVSLSSLLSPGAPGRTASGAAFGSASVKTAPDVPQQNRVPAWLFGAIALTCTAGSMLISKQLRQPSMATTMPPRAPVAAPPRRRPRQGTKRLSPYSSAADMPLPLRRQPQPQLRSQPVQFSAPMPFVPPSQRPLPPQLHPPRQVTVTVVPDAENHPLDWGTPSLADSLDIRKQRSIASWAETPYRHPGIS